MPFEEPKIEKGEIEKEEIEKEKEKKIQEITEKFLSFENLEKATEFLEKGNFTPKEIQEAAKKGMIKSLEKEWPDPDSALEIKEKFNLPEEFLSLPEIQEAAKKGMISWLEKGQHNYALAIKEKFNLPEEFLSLPEIQEAAKKGMINRLEKGWSDIALAIKEKFNLPEEFSQEAAKKGMISCLEKGWPDSALAIKEKFNLPEEFLSSSEIQEAAKKEMINRLEEGQPNWALAIKEKFNLKIDIKEILRKFPDIENLVNKITEKEPIFKEKVLSSFELFSSLFEIKDKEKFLDSLEENSFLISALENNPRYGPRLLVKYHQFDSLSKENIKKLFDSKEEILKENPDLDPQSRDFGKEIQERLKKYKENPKIIKEIEKSNINLDKWLNYDKVDEFYLTESGKFLSFSEKIQTPLGRITETISEYLSQTKETLAFYQKELSQIKVSTEKYQRIEEKLKKLAEELKKAEEEKNLKKIEGIKRGISSLERSKETIREEELSLSQKIEKDSETISKSIKKILKSQEELKDSENKKEKEKISKRKEKIRDEISFLDKKIEEFRKSLPENLSFLGEERAESLVQEIETPLRESFSHYPIDKSTLEELFSLEAEKSRKKLEGRKMEVRVWSRNPDIDLYQGNYSPCCISIESGGSGYNNQSTISDYLTDLSIQIVNIYDSKRKIPVVSAWSWLGESQKKEKVLVIDNIEANTDYSSHFKRILTEKLFKYLREYAKEIKVEKVVLGTRNNDLPSKEDLEKMKTDKNEYLKIGPFNRSDGYYLEAENEEVKIIENRRAFLLFLF